MLEDVLIVGRGPVASFLVSEYIRMGVNPIIASVEGDNWWDPSLGLKVHWLSGDLLHKPGGIDEIIKEIVSIAVAYKREGKEVGIDPGVSPHFAENPNLPFELEGRGIKFIGPDYHALVLASDKIEMRFIAQEAGVPLMPWARAYNLENASMSAKNIEYPVMVKEAINGGGRGTMRADNEQELKQAYSLLSARNPYPPEIFHSPYYLVSQRIHGANPNRLFVEKALEDRRHIEVQFLVGPLGEVYCFGTRDCSEQRNFQKMIELAPADISQELEQRLIDDGVKIIMGIIAKSRSLAYADGNFMFNPYRGAITVEYIVDSKGNYYFIETNGRYQVEAAVSIMSTGENIANYRWEVANGKGLKMDRGEYMKIFPAKYHVIESRITAERYDPVTGAFTPSPYLVTEASFPSHSDLWVHSSLRVGGEVPYQFDPHVVSMLARGRTMGGAMELMMVSLKKTSIVGIDTTIQYHIGRLNEALKNGTTPHGSL